MTVTDGGDSRLCMQSNLQNMLSGCRRMDDFNLLENEDDVLSVRAEPFCSEICTLDLPGSGNDWHEKAASRPCRCRVDLGSAMCLTICLCISPDLLGG